MNGSKTALAKVTKVTKVEWVNDEVAQAIEEPPKEFALSSLPGLASQIHKLGWFLQRFGIPLTTDFAPGFVIQGGEGTGKTMLVNRIANSDCGNVMRAK